MDFELERNQMVELQLIQRGIRNERVLKAMRKVSRHLFMEPALRERAYGDYPLPIGEGQTISQPYIVGYMSEALDLTGTEKVLEIGTGSGYQTAILAELAEQVFSIERIKSLALKAREVLDALGYHNVAIKIFDGSYGWAEQAPFDAILVTAGAPKIPRVFIDQLAERGRLVIPVGGESYQILCKISKGPNGIRTQKLSNCVFVKLIGEHGWKE
ncbi:MAG TPA: protein-L-isoaspartate(D-aspartate) O-methyltransferase [bacterium]|nr:protein-L-isoaspartate(D-aspartate) O-methyltransferase [bacterium]